MSKGLKLVPIEPTASMLVAGKIWLRHWQHMRETDREGALSQAWHAMLSAAAPQPTPERAGREVSPEALGRLADLLIMLADKEDGVGMSYEAPTWKGLSGERLNLYGKRAHAAYRLLNEGRAFADAILALRAMGVGSDG